MRAALQLDSPATQRTVLAAELALLAGLMVMFVVRGLIPAWTKLQTDFPNYYIAARLLHEHYAMGSIYDWIWFQRIKDHWAIPQELVGFLGLTPFSALPVYPLTWLDALGAKRVWLVENFALLAAIVAGLARITRLNVRHVLLIAFLAAIPLRSQFLYGQMHLLVVALILLAFWLDSNDRWLSCGVALGAAAALKIYPIFFVFYFLRKRQWKSALALGGATLAFFAACFPIFGSQAMRAFFFAQFPRMLRGEATDPFSLTAPSVSSLFHRLFLAHRLANPHPAFSSPLICSLAYPLCQLCVFSLVLFAIRSTRTDRQRRGLEWATWACLLLALSTEPASYHRVLLILVTALALPAIEGWRMRSALLASYFVACNLFFSIPAQKPALALVLDFMPYWGLLAMLCVLVIALRRKRTDVQVAPATVLRMTSPSLMLWSGAALCAWAALAATTYIHIRSIMADNFVTDGSVSAYARFTPQLAKNHLLSVAMQRPGYRIQDETGYVYRTETQGVADDQLAIASTPVSDRVWIEAVNDGRSNLVEVQLGANETELAPLAEIADAESPALAPDAKALVFVRETKGRGRAWMVRLDGEGRVTSDPEPILPEKMQDEMNVRRVSFVSPDEVLISTAADEAPHLFAASHGPSPLRLVALASASASQVKLDADQPVLLQRRSGGSLRIFASRPGAAPMQLTFGDCNAYDPIWEGRSTLVYISDCGRGNGLGALAKMDGVLVPNEAGKAAVAANVPGTPNEETRQ